MSLIKREDISYNILNGEVYCNSLDIAKEFDKKHTDVLRSIRAEIIRHLVDDGLIDAKYLYDQNGKEFNLSDLSKRYENLKEIIYTLRKHFKEYFIDTTYITSRGKENPRFDLTFDGFQLIVLGYQGTKARKNKKRFIFGFKELLRMVKDNKQIASSNKVDSVMIGLRRDGKVARTKFTDALQEYFLPQRVAENKETSQFIERYISSFTTHIIYKSLGIEVPKGITVNRDAFTAKQVIDVERLEEKISTLIEDYAKDGIHYKDIYKLIKSKLATTKEI